MRRGAYVVRRRALLALGLCFAASAARADEDVAVPVPLRMELLLKVASYDRNLPSRAAQRRAC